MDPKKLYDRVCATLEADARQLWGGIGKAEEKSCGVGNIGRFCKGTREISVRHLFEFLCAAGTHPSGFFARALGLPLDSAMLLVDLITDHRSSNRLWRDVERAAVKLESNADVEVEAPRFASTGEITDLVDGMEQATLREQMRRLRETERYRDRGFATAYLKHLDAQRDDDPDRARRLVARVAIHLIPMIPGPLKARIELQCEALGVFGSAQRLKTRFSTAARALHLALDLAERYDLAAARGRLLHRIAHLLEDAGNTRIALIPLREALEIYVHINSADGIGKTLVVQGRIYCCVKEYQRAIQVLERSLNYLPEDQQEFARYHFSAYQSLSAAYEELGNFQEARLLLAKASTFTNEQERVRQANLLWQEGGLCHAEGDFEHAEALLDGSQQRLAKHVNATQQALVTVDLVRSLLNQGKVQEACETASSTARFLEALEGHPMAEAAILQLAQAAIEGRLNLQVVHEVRCQLEEAHPEGRAR